MKSVSALLLLLLLTCGLRPVLAGPPEVVVAQSEQDLTKALNLSKDQTSRLEAVHQRYAGQKQSLRQAVATRRQTLVSQMSSDDPDRGAVQRLLQEIVSLEGQRQKLMVDEYFEVLQILTPQQRRIFRTRVLNQIVP